MKIGYLGPEASFSHIATEKVFPKEELVAIGSIVKIFDMVEDGQIERAIVPIENSSGGSVATTLNELLEKNLKIVGEYFSHINYCFLSKENNSVKKIYSHAQGFLQCKDWIKKNYPNSELIECSSNSKASEIASKENASALSTKDSAKVYGLKLIEETVNDSKNNQTRFVVIGKKEEDSKGKEKTSCFFALKDKPGALLDSLLPLKENSINMTKIESRPSKESAWEYVFFVEFEGNLEEERIKKALEEIKEHTTHIKLLGSYSKV